MAASNNHNDNERTAEPHNRPTMEALHQLLQNRQWDQVQHSIRLDASVAIRIDDSAEEDCWVEEVRRRWIASAADDDETEQITSDKLRHFYKQMKMKNQCKSSSREEDDGDPPMQLRYWVGNGMNNNNTSEAYKLRRMTLLHSLCRLDFSSQELQGDGSQDDDLQMAIQTAEMIISASHNEQQPCCPCHYCPPMFFPSVSKGVEEDEEEEDMTITEDVLHTHTSALTIPDKMGGTPLHELTSSGSNHVIELIKVLFRGCAPLDDNDSGQSQRRPTVYDLLTAPNDHGSTPLHFISECHETYDEGVLRYVLEQCPLFIDSHDARIHPSMIGDNEGDLPLHYALSNCAPPACLDMLTTLGDRRSTLNPNSQHKLPIDVLIEWYHDNLEDFFEKQNTDSDESEESEGDSDDDEESSSSESLVSEEVITDNSTQHLEEVASAEVAANVSRPVEDMNTTSVWNVLERNNLCRDLFPLNSCGKCYLCPGKSFGLVMQGLISEGSSDFWESDMWKQMIVLINAAAAAIVNSNGIANTNDARSYSSVLQSNPLHAAVIATKHGNFPAFALAMASPLDPNYRNEMAATYYLGYLPLHLVCGDISILLNSAHSRQKKYQDQQNPSTEQCNELVRFNTSELRMTMIQYLLLLCPEAAHIPTKEQGELPLHLFLRDERALWNYVSKKKLGHACDVNSVPFDPLQSTSAARDSPDTPMCTPWDEIKSLLSACPEALSTPSVTNHLYPFQLAATASHSLSLSSDERDVDVQKKTRLLSLENTYQLILEDPSAVYRNVSTC
eukprot:scaffold14112_cov152-Skeletonema_marinoi.AAC.7